MYVKREEIKANRRNNNNQKWAKRCAKGAAAKIVQPKISANQSKAKVYLTTAGSRRATRVCVREREGDKS